MAKVRGELICKKAHCRCINRAKSCGNHHYSDSCFEMVEEILCIFCDKDMSKEKFREDYTLLAWRDDPEDPSSLNKQARTAHIDCYGRFLTMNRLTSY
jgi:hypothetical protein